MQVRLYREVLPSAVGPPNAFILAASFGRFFLYIVYPECTFSIYDNVNMLDALVGANFFAFISVPLCISRKFLF